MEKDTNRLWEKLKRMGNFKDSYYDNNILDDMLHRWTMKNEAELIQMSPEELLDAFFDTMLPLSLMYEDILCLFEQCNAKESSENIEIQFDFSKAGSFRFNAEHFKTAKEVMREISEIQKNLFVTEGDLERLDQLISENLNFDISEIQSGCFWNWYRQYTERRNEWPSAALDFEKTVTNKFEKGEMYEDIPIGNAFIEVYECWKVLFRYYKDTGISREHWYQEVMEKDDTVRTLLYRETDLFLGTVLKTLYFMVENWDKLNIGKKKKIIVNLKSFLEKGTYRKKRRKKWEEYLRLPVWKRRYEIYSIWIFAQMVKKILPEHMEFHVKNGVLTFPFSGACVATIREGDKSFQIWSELRTEAFIKPVGRGRVKSIQPDYSILFGEENPVKDTIAVIECKQYKKQNTKNFSDVLFDYTYNRPNAKVLLVDYGEIVSNKIQLALPFVDEERYELLSLCRPDTESAERFSDRIVEILREKGYQKQCPNTGGRISLHWDGENKTQDLDLWMTFRSANHMEETKYLSYRQNQIEEAAYSGDVRMSPGEEIITVEDWEEGVYDIWVNNYSKEYLFYESNSFLLLSCSQTSECIKIEFPADADELPWWHVLRFDTNENVVHIINRLENNME